MPIFEKRTRINAPPEEVFAFHELPDALERLTPPFEEVRVIEKTRGLKVGARVVMRTRVGPIMARWEAEHTDYEQGRMFRDRQAKGPFAKWVHTHRFEPDGQGGSWLIDEVDYELPLGALGRLFGGGFVRQKLERMFDYRHRVTKEACERRA